MSSSGCGPAVCSAGLVSELLNGAAKLLHDHHMLGVSLGLLRACLLQCCLLRPGVSVDRVSRLSGRHCDDSAAPMPPNGLHDDARPSFRDVHLGGCVSLREIVKMISPGVMAGGGRVGAAL